ncbi:hypothetical protein CEXT_656321 [Caerostris extrusa]|uniref:Uncharacterized protein n=1 Tax=Caerostris extrusa TaxID=172846 RepID=A0AAV4TG18_CAEEX|nr:hypothetical protein CEXT_656321 [Caerostris extrusa]
MRKRSAPESGLLGYETIASAVAWQRSLVAGRQRKGQHFQFDFKIDALRTVHNDRTNKSIQVEPKECYQLL